MKSTTGGQHSFAQVPQANIQRSSFDRSCGWKGTLDSGYLVPFFTEEVLPGDTFNHRSTIFGRMATPIYPVMDNMFLDTFFFFVPNRLIFDNWVKLMGEQDNPGDSTDYILPTSTSGISGYGEQSLQDYMGLPTKKAGVEHMTLPMRAYNLIYNEWFRDQNLQDSVVVDKGDGPDDPDDYVLLRRGKRHDYFTSALPWPQKGPAVTIPTASTAPIYVDGTIGENIGINMTADDAIHLINVDNVSNAKLGAPSPSADLMYADLSSATASTINQLREAFQIQKMFEKDARGGTRYTEMVRSHFGVVSPDARLQRPEYLGGGTTPVNVSAVQSTADTADASSGRNVGDLGAMATVTAMNHGFTKSFTEHGIIIGLVNIRADLNYQQGLNRMWSRSDRFDFYFPSLAHLGEQEVLNQEIFFDDNPSTSHQNEEVFGYQERYAEYRYKPSQVVGQFRSNASTPLDAWHLAQEFDDLPILGDEFIQDNPPIDRVIATPEEPQFIIDCFHKTVAARPMPLFGVPGNLDRY